MLKHINKYIAVCLTFAISAAMLASCTETDQSNKAERNSIRKGNKLYNKSKFAEAAEQYTEALEANANSDVAQYNLAMSKLKKGADDTTALKEARETLHRLCENSANAEVSEKALYNLGNDAVYTGDYLKMVSEDKSGKVDPQLAQEAGKQYAEFYRQAIELYKKILRKNPKSMRALQNLRITQLKLPPEDNNNQNQQQQQQQQEQQQQQQEQQQQQQQQQQQPKQNQDDQQVLQSIQAKENKTRRNQESQPAKGSYTTDKPW